MNNFIELPNDNGIQNEQILLYFEQPIQAEPVIDNNQQSTTRPPKKPRALAYKFFEWEEASSRFKCKLCEKTYAVPKSGGTGSLNNHMDRDHKAVFGIAKREKNLNGELPTTSNSSQNTEDRQVTFAPEIITSEMFRIKLITFMVCCDEPFTLSENPFFRDFVNYISGGNNECKLFCAKTVKSIMTEVYQEYKSNIKSTLKNNDGKISFVIDAWTSSNQYPFQGVIARWISDDWELCSTVLDLTILKGSHDGVNLAASFSSVLNDYELHDKLLSVTTDNASNMDTMFAELEKLLLERGIKFDSKNFRVRCFAHIMNLSCQAMIQSVGDGDAKTYGSDDDSDEEDEKKAKVLPVVAKLRKGVVAIRNSTQRREILARQCIAAKIQPPKVVLRDVRTRWNSTHSMMERAQELREPFDLTLTSIPKKRKFVLDDNEWVKVDELMKLLAPFKEATEMLSNEHSPTVSRISAVYQELFNHLENYKKNDICQGGAGSNSKINLQDKMRFIFET